MLGSMQHSPRRLGLDLLGRPVGVLLGQDAADCVARAAPHAGGDGQALFTRHRPQGRHKVRVGQFHLADVECHESSWPQLTRLGVAGTE